MKRNFRTTGWSNIFLFFLFSISISTAQNYAEKKYFDKSGKEAFENGAYYYRVPMDGQGNYKSFYMNGGAVYFEGKILTANNLDENKNVYTGVCKWFYKNGKNKTIRTFNELGEEDGTSSYYFESGKLWKEINYAKGQIVNNRYKEYDENGGSSRIFEEDFSNNNNDWDVYNSDKSASVISKGVMELASFTSEGASRYISIPIESQEYTIEAVVNILNLKDGDKAGIIFGFKDWQNYNYFLITSGSFYIGFVYEGVSSSSAAGMYSSSVVKKGSNTIKLISNGEKILYSLNGEIQFTAERPRLYGSNTGIAVSGKSSVTIDKMIVKEMDFKSTGVTTSASDMDVKATGSGVVFTKSGYILTNYHVIDNANKIVVEFYSGGTPKSYNAVVVQKDKDNDLAILKIDDPDFKPFETLSYSFKENGAVDVGASAFTIGYPLALSGMGKEAKFTDGKISAKTGYNNAINSFQTSIPVQPGNSGGPVFTDKGQLIGLINSSVEQTDNVSYAIKLNYLKNIVELLPEAPELPKDVSIANLPLEEKIKVLTNYVPLIKIK